MTDKELMPENNIKQRNFAIIWKEYFLWYWKSKTIYDLHSPSAYSLARLFLQLKKGDKEGNLRLLDSFRNEEMEIYYLTKKQTIDLPDYYHLQPQDGGEKLIYAENFRSFADPSSFSTNLPSKNSILIEGCDQLLCWIKAEGSQQIHIPLVNYVCKFWRAGLFSW